MSIARAVRLSGGRVLRIRPVRPGDERALGQLYRSLSADDRHRRFFTAAYRPSKEALHKWVEAESRGGYRLVAVLDDEIVGDAGYYPLDDSEDAEFDITVGHDFRGWLGPYLLDALVETAASRGIRNLQADILRENRTMFALVAARGFMTIENDDPNVTRVLIGARDALPHWPTRGSGDRVLVESASASWHAAGPARSNGLEVAVCPGPRSADHHCPVLRGEPCPLVEEADAVVFSLPLDDPDARRVLEAHPELHPDTVLCVESHDEPRETNVPLPEKAVALDANDPLETDAVVRALGREPHLPRRSPPPRR